MKEPLVIWFWITCIPIHTANHWYIFDNVTQADLQFRQKYLSKNNWSLDSNVQTLEHVIYQLSSIKSQNSWNLGSEERNKNLQIKNLQNTSPQKYRRLHYTIVFSSFINGFLEELSLLTSGVATLSKIHCFSYNSVHIFMMFKTVPYFVKVYLNELTKKCNMLIVMVTYDFQIASPFEYSLQHTYSFAFCQFCSNNQFLFSIDINTNSFMITKLRKNLLKKASLRGKVILYVQEKDYVGNLDSIPIHMFAQLASDVLNFTFTVHSMSYWYRPLDGLIESYKGFRFNGSSKELRIFPGQYSIFKRHSIDFIVIYCENHVHTVSSSPTYLLEPFTRTCWALLLASIIVGTFVTAKFSRKKKFLHILFNSVLRFLLRQDTQWPNYWHLFLAFGFFILNTCYEAEITSLVIKPNPPKVYSSVIEMFADGYKFLLDYQSNEIQQEFIEIYGYEYFLLDWPRFFPELVSGFQLKNISSSEAASLIDRYTC